MPIRQDAAGDEEATAPPDRKRPSLLRFLFHYRMYRQLRPFTMLPRGAFLANLYLADKCLAAPRMDGAAVVECGTWRGGMAAGLATIGGPARDYHFFDSFAGLPPPTPEDGEYALRAQRDRSPELYFDNNTASIEEFMAALAPVALPGPRLHVHKGLFADTLPRAELVAGSAEIIKAGFIADPTIADIQVKSPRLVYILGKQSGETSLFAVDADEHVIANRRIIVNHDLNRLRSALKAILPNDNVSVRSVDNRVVLRGAVRTPVEAEEVNRLAAGIVKDPKMLVNQVGVTAPSQVYLRVVKNTLARRAAEGTGVKAAGEMFSGPVAIAYGNDPVGMAKAISEFAKDHERFEVKGGLLEGKFIDPQGIKALASLPPREVLLAQVLGTMQAPLGAFVRTMAEVPASFVRTLAAIRDQKQAA